MEVKRARKSIRRPVTVISAAAGEAPIEVTPRQIAIGKGIAVALGAVPVAALLLAFYSNMGEASPPAPEAIQMPDRAAEEAAQAKADAKVNARGAIGTFYSSCTETLANGVRVHRSRQLRYEFDEVRESSSDDCGTAKSDL
jgi:hypothetical protein